MTICFSTGSLSVFAAESAAGADDVQTYANSPVVLTVKDSNTGAVKKTYTVQDIINLGMEESYPITGGNCDKMVFQKISSRNDADQSAWYGATGVTAEWLIRDLGIWDTFETVTFMSTDNTVMALTKSQIQSPAGYYFADTSDRKALVYPMIALWYTESIKNDYTDPQRPEVNAAALNENAPRLFVGQNGYNEKNAGYLLKKINTVYVEFPADDLYKVPPTIKGVPDEPIYLQKGQQFTEPSNIEAADAYGQRVNINRTVINEDGTLNYIDTEKTGVYTITYTATDRRGNVTKKELKVYVEESLTQKGTYAIGIQNTTGCTISREYSNELNVDASYNGTASFSVTVTPEKRYGSTQNVVFVHYRGNKLVNISSQILSINNAKRLNGSFSVKGGDSIRIFVADQLNSTKGVGAFLLNDMNTDHKA